MKENNDKQISIDRYILGEMKENETAAFEKQLAQDAELRTETMLTRHIVSAIRKKGEQEAIEAMKTVSREDVKKWITEPRKSEIHNQKISSSKHIGINHRRTVYLTLTSAAAAIIILLLYIGYQPRYSTGELLSQYYQVQPYESVPVRGGYDLTPDEREWMQQAETNYREANYTNALSFYNLLIAKKEDWKTLPDEALFHTAICRLETGDLPGAINLLEYISDDNKSDFHDDASWNLIFAYLKDRRRNKAKECLEQLIASESAYTESAIKLLLDLKEKKWF